MILTRKHAGSMDLLHMVYLKIQNMCCLKKSMFLKA